MSSVEAVKTIMNSLKTLGMFNLALRPCQQRDMWILINETRLQIDQKRTTYDKFLKKPLFLEWITLKVMKTIR